MERNLLCADNSFIKRWYDIFSIKEYVRVGIARKTPRLWELCTQELGQKPDGIITEHALPFIIPYLKDEEKILLSDDAIYYGTTFERIHAVILTGLGLYGKKNKRDDIKSLPVVMSKDAKRILPYINIPYSDVCDSEKRDFVEDLIIEPSCLPNYIDSLVNKFQTLGKPYDIEFPIFYIKLGDHHCLEKLVYGFENRIRELLESIPDSEKTFDITGCYKTSHPMPQSEQCSINYTILLEDIVVEKDYRISSDFRKLRFFHSSGGECCITSYAPHIITENVLVKDNPLFVGTIFEECWCKVYEALQIPQPIAYSSEFKDYIFRNDSDSSDSLEELWDDQIAEYIYHCKRSLVIWCNYLLSFYKFLETKDILESTLKSVADGCRLDLKSYDLALILGDRLTKEIQPVLQEMLDKPFDKFSLPIVGIDPIKNFDAIPEKLEDDFLFHCREDFKTCTTVSNLISAEFSNQHRWLERKSREALNIFYDRLRYGSSYTSLYQKFLFSSYNIKDIGKLKLRLHQGIDYRIDLGSVVPKYICQQKNNKNNPWIRLFKSGENEDKLRDQLNHIILRGLYRLSELCSDSSIPQWMVDLFFNIIFGNITSERQFKNFIGVKFDVIYNNGEYHTRVYNEVQPDELDSEPVYLTDLCERYGLIKYDEDGFYVIQDNVYTKYLNGYGDILDDDVRKDFDRYTDVAYWLCYKTDEGFTREIINWFYVKDISKIDVGLSDWKTRFLSSYINITNADWDDEFQDLLDEFCDIYDQFPYDEIMWLEPGENNEPYYKTDIADKKAIENIIPVLHKIEGDIIQNREKIKRGSGYKQFNDRLDIYNAALNLFIDRLDLNYQDTQLDIDLITKKFYTDSQLSDWIGIISENKDAFQKYDLEEFKKNIAVILKKI